MENLITPPQELLTAKNIFFGGDIEKFITDEYTTSTCSMAQCLNSLPASIEMMLQSSPIKEYLAKKGTLGEALEETQKLVDDIFKIEKNYPEKESQLPENIFKEITERTKKLERFFV